MPEPTPEEVEAFFNEMRQPPSSDDPFPAASPEPDGGTSSAMERVLRRMQRGPVVGSAPTGAHLPMGDPEEAESELFRAYTERFEQEGHTRATAARLANEAVRQQFPVTSDIEGTPTLGESAQLALQPRITRRDRRPISEAQRLELGGQAAAQGLVTGPGALAPRSLRELIVETVGEENVPYPNSGIAFETVGETLRMDEWAGFTDRFPNGDAVGLRAENQTMWGLRVLGHGLVSGVQETLMRWPAPAFDELPAAWEPLWVDGDLMEAMGNHAQWMFGSEFSTVGEQLLGLDQFERGQRIDRRDEGAIADWLQGVFERVETGRGLETDFELGAKARFGQLPRRESAAFVELMVGGGPQEALRILQGEVPDEELPDTEQSWGRIGWWTGMFLDLGVNWEQAPFKVANVAGTVGRRARAVQSALPDTWQTEIGVMGRALVSPEIETAEYLGRRAGGAVEDGSLNPERLSDETKHLMNGVAMSEYGMTWRELARLQGLDVDDGARVTDEFGDLRRSAEPPEGFMDGVRQRSPAGPAADADRVELPPVRLDSMADYWDLARGGAFNLPRHSGYERLRHLEPGAGPRTPNYVLRNDVGDIVGTGTLQEMIDLVAQRGSQFNRFDDEIWFGSHRIVARWRTVASRSSSRSPLAPDHFFSSPAERDLITSLARPLRRADRAARGGPNLVRRATAHAVADVIMRGPFARAMDTRELGALGSVVQEAFRLQTRIHMPSSRLSFLATGALAATRDVRRIHGRAAEILTDLGLDEQRLFSEVLSGQREITIAEGRALTRLAQRLGVDLDDVSFPGKQVQREPVAVPGQPRLGGQPQIPVRRSGEPEPAARLQDDRRVHRIIRTGQLHPAHLRAVRNALIGEVGGVLADVQYRVRGAPMFADRVQQALVHGSSIGTGGLRRISREVGHSLFGRASRGLSPQAKEVFDRWRNQLSRNAERIAERLRAAKREIEQRLPRGSRLNPMSRANPADVIAEVMDDFSPVPPRQAVLAYQIFGDSAVPSPAHLATLGLRELRELSQQVFQAVRHTMSYRAVRASGAFDWVGSSNRASLEDGLMQWAQRTYDDIAVMSEDYLISVAAVELGASRSSDVAQAVRALPQETKVQVYHEVFRAGTIDGAWVRSAFADAGLGELPQRIDGNAALLRWMMQSQAERDLANALDELAGVGVVHRSLGDADPRRHVLTSTLRGTNTVTETLADGTTRTRSRFPEALQTWANQTLETWGLRAGVQETFETLGARRGPEFVVPSYLRQEIQRALQLGEHEATALFASALSGTGKRGEQVGRALDTMMRSWKSWTLGVFIVPKMAHYLGQMLGVVPILWTTRGLRGTADTAQTFARHPMMVGELMRRVGAPDHWVFASNIQGARVFQTADGGVYHVDELAEAARAGGLGDTVFTVETSGQLRSMLDDMDLGAMDPRRIRNGFRWWNEYLQEAAGTFDQMARMSVFLDEVHKGATLQAAAMRAREALYDYRNLPYGEQKFARMIFSFYAFMRKNVDAYVSALFRHPERVMSQMRLTHEAVQGPGLLNLFAGEQRDRLTESELGGLRDPDIGRLILYSTNEVINEDGRVHPTYRQNRWVSTPLGVAEWLGTMRMFTDREWRPGLSRENIGQSVIPVWQHALLLAAGDKLGRDWKPDSFNANRIPPVMLEGPWGPAVMWYFGVGPIPIREGLDDPAMADPAATAANHGIPSVWSAGRKAGLRPEGQGRGEMADLRNIVAAGPPENQEDAWTRWQIFMTWFGGPVSHAGHIGRAAGELESSPNITQMQELLSLMSGARAMGVKSEHTLIREDRRQRMFELREATRRATPDPQ